MISKTYILHNLSIAKRLYGSSANSKESLLLSKLAVIELCGWVEDSYDEIFRKCLKKNVHIPHNIKEVKSIISSNWGFEYNKHFKNVVIKIIGYKLYENFEKRIDPLKRDKFMNAVGIISRARDIEAHSYLKVLRTIDSPAKLISYVQDIYEGLQDMILTMKELKII